MLEAAKHLLTPSKRSNVSPFMVMDVMAAAALLEARGARVVHMEVGQPAAPAPATAIAAAQAALAHGRIGYTETLGVPSLRARIARHYADSYVRTNNVILPSRSVFETLDDQLPKRVPDDPGYPPLIYKRQFVPPKDMLGDPKK